MEQIDFVNPGIDEVKWHHNENKFDILYIPFLMIGITVGFGIVWIVSSNFDLAESVWWNIGSVVLLISSVVGAIFWGSKVQKNLEAKYKKDTEDYRKSQVPKLVEGLASIGYTIGPGSINTLEWNTQPTIFDSEGNRFSTSRFMISRETVYFFLNLNQLSDNSIHTELTKLLDTYENENGELSDSEREIFMSAAQLGFEYADR